MFSPFFIYCRYLCLPFSGQRHGCLWFKISLWKFPLEESINTEWYLTGQRSRTRKKHLTPFLFNQLDPFFICGASSRVGLRIINGYKRPRDDTRSTVRFDETQSKLRVLLRCFLVRNNNRDKRTLFWVRVFHFIPWWTHVWYPLFRVRVVETDRVSVSWIQEWSPRSGPHPKRGVHRYSDRLSRSQVRGTGGIVLLGTNKVYRQDFLRFDDPSNYYVTYLPGSFTRGTRVLETLLWTLVLTLLSVRIFIDRKEVGNDTIHDKIREKYLRP